MADDIARLGIAVDSSSVPVGTRHLDGLTNAARRAEDGVSRLIRGATKLVTAYASWRVLEGVFKSFINNTSQAEKAVAQLEAVVRSTGGAAGLTTRELTKMASELQKVTTYGDEAIMSAQGLLLTFTKIGREAFPEALEAVMNVATAMGGDLKGAALQVGKALNDPVLGMTSLTRSGIQFSKAQKDLVKELVDTGNVAKAQQVILKELEVQFGGSARAARDTLGGALQALQEAWGDVFELNGPAAEKMKDNVERLISLITSPAFIEGVQAIGVAMFDAFTGALTAIQAVIMAVRTFFAGLNDPYLRRQQEYGSKEEALSALGEHLGQKGRNKFSLAGPKSFGDMDEFFRPFRSDGVGDGASYNGMLSQMGLYKPPTMAAGSISGDKAEAEAERLAKAYDRITLSANERIAQLEIEARSLGMTQLEADKLRITQELLADATRSGIEVTAEQNAELVALADELAAAEERVRNLTEAYEFGKSVFGSFFKDMKSELQQGASFWDALGNAANRALDRIIDKALDMAANGIWDMIFNAFMGGMSGGFGVGKGLTGAATYGNTGNGIYGVPGFSDGGSFRVGGTGGTDSQMVRFRASPDERVTITKPGQGGFGSEKIEVIVVNNSSGQVKEGSTTVERGTDGALRISTMIEDVVAKGINRPGSPINLSLQKSGVQSQLTGR